MTINLPMPENGFKRALAAGERQIGAFLGLADAYAAELMATTGFDWLLVDGEHGPNDLRAMLAQLQALAAYPVHTVVRPPDHSASFIKRLLDIGAQSLLIPMVESADQARELVRAVRYPPAGRRGIGTGMARAARWNGVPDYFARADEEICLIVQIESRAGLDALPEIAAVEGVDGLFLGPADLAGALGHLGQPAHPEVRAVIEAALPQICGAGKAAGVYCNDPQLAAAYGDLGAGFFLVAADTLLLRTAAEAQAGRFRY